MVEVVNVDFIKVDSVTGFMGAVAPMETAEAQEMKKGAVVPMDTTEVEKGAVVPMKIMEVERAVVPDGVIIMDIMNMEKASDWVVWRGKSPGPSEEGFGAPYTKEAEGEGAWWDEMLGSDSNICLCKPADLVVPSKIVVEEEGAPASDKPGTPLYGFLVQVQWY